MAVLKNNVLLYHYDENGRSNVSYHFALSGYELAYSVDGPFPNYYRIWAQKGGDVSEITIGGGGEMKIEADAHCSSVTVLAEVGGIKSPLLEVFGSAEDVVASSIVRVEEGGVLEGLKVLKGGKVSAYSKSTVIDAEACSGGNLTLYLSSVGSDIAVKKGGYLGIQSGSTAVNVTVDAGGVVSTLYSAIVDTMSVAKGASCLLGDKTVLTGDIRLAEAPELYGDIDASCAEVFFMLQDRTPADGMFISDWTKCAFGASSISVGVEQDYGLYLLAGNAYGKWSAGLYVGNEKIGVLTTGNVLGQGEDVYYMGYVNGGVLAFVKDECSYVLLSQDASFADYAVAQTFDKAISVYAVRTRTPLVAGRKASSKEWDGDVYCEASEIKSGSQLVQPAHDRVADIVLPAASGVWDFDFCAFNANLGSYRGIAGKNRYDEVVWSGGDAALVMLSDAADALFADDVFTDMPNGVKGTDARLKAIAEIRAGSGDDLVDLSMEHAADANQNVILRGGGGNDVLWSGNDGARLFGDSGDDELAGGAGNDLLAGGEGDDLLIGLGGQNVYAFGLDSGNDAVALTPDEDFRFWFEDGVNASIVYDYDEASAVIALDGGASIYVTGLTTDDLSERIFFGKAEGATFAGWDYDSLTELGAFDADSSVRFFKTIA